MRPLPLLVLLVLSPLAGCLGDDAGTGSAPDEAVDSPTGEGLSLQRSSASDESGTPGASAANGTPPGLLQNITAFYWGTDAELGDTALEIRFDFGTENDCEIFVGNLGYREGSGVSSVAIYEADGLSGWGSSGGGSPVHVRAAGVDTEEVITASGGYGSISGTGGPLAGEWIVTRVALGVGVVDEIEEFTSGQSLFVQVECTGVFDALGARVGFEATVSDQRLRSGTYADATMAGNVALDTIMALEVTSGDGHVRFGSFGDQIGEVALSAPGGSQSYTVPLETGGHLNGEAGAYGVQLMRAGANFEAFWAAAYGLSEDVDLEPGIKEGRLYEPPF